MKSTQKIRQYILSASVGLLCLASSDAFAGTDISSRREIITDKQQFQETETAAKDLIEGEGDLATGSNALPASFSLLRGVSNVIVTTPQEFQAALENPAVDTIVFGNDIAMTIPAVSIETRRANPNLVIDGGGYNFSEYFVKSQDATKGILIKNNATKSTLKNVTLKNFNMINGGNGYGTIYVTASFADDHAINLIYDNIRYKGPQLTHNIKGTAEYINSNITLDYARKLDSTGKVTDTGTYIGEVGALLYARLDGGINITRRGAADCVRDIFLLSSGAVGIDIEPDANVIVNNETNTPCGLSVFAYGSTAKNTFNIGDNARFHYYGYSQFTEYFPFYDMTIGDNAEVNIEIHGGALGLGPSGPVMEVKDYLSAANSSRFTLTAVGNTKKSVLVVGQRLTVNEHAEFDVFSLENFQKSDVSGPTVYLGGRASTTSTTLEVNSPERVLFYNSNENDYCNQKDVLGFANTLKSDITAYRIRYWETSDMDITPSRDWVQNNDFNITALVRCYPGSKVDQVNTINYNRSITKDEYSFSKMNVVMINGSDNGGEKPEEPTP